MLTKEIIKTVKGNELTIGNRTYIFSGNMGSFDLQIDTYENGEWDCELSAYMQVGDTLDEFEWLKRVSK